MFLFQKKENKNTFLSLSENRLKIEGISSTHFLSESYHCRIALKLEPCAAEIISCADSWRERQGVTHLGS